MARMLVPSAAATRFGLPPCGFHAHSLRNQSVGQDVQGGRLRALVADDHPHQDVRRRRLRVVDLDDPVAVVVEDAGVEQLEFRLELGALCGSPR